MDPDLFEKICVHAAKRRLKEFFTDFDKLRTRVVTPEIAVRALFIAGLVLTVGEQQQIKAAYRLADGSWDYEQFILDVNDRKPNGFYESRAVTEADPALDSSRRRAEPSPLNTSVALLPRARMPSAAEEDAVEALLAAMRHEAVQRGLVLKTFMKDLDKAHRGTVTKTRFARELSACFRCLGPADVALLARAYETPDGRDVRYMALNEDVTPDDPEVVSASKGIRVALQDATLSPRLRREETARLKATSPRSARRFGLGSSGSVEGFMPYPGSPRSAASSPGGVAAGGAGGALSSSASAGTFALPHGEPERTEALIVRQVYERRIRVLDLLADYDRSRLKRITREQFIRGLSLCAFAQVTTAGLGLVADKYADPTFPGHVRYVAFSDAVEEAFAPKGLEADPRRVETLGQSFARTVAAAPSARFQPQPETEVAAALRDKALTEIRRIVAQRRIFTLTPMLRDFDRTHEGYITTTHFERQLAVLGLVPADPAERVALYAHYRGPTGKEHMTDYRAFLQDLYQGSQ